MRRVFVVSDLHLGGRPDDAARAARPPFQINYSQEALVEFIDWVANFGPTAELVINGDFVDFLSEDDWDDPIRACAFNSDEQHAIAKLRTALDHSKGRGGRSVPDALRDLLAKGTECTILLGNHDLELSLPSVRAYLESTLAIPGRRPRFIYDGEAYTIGRLLIEHGNRYDAWNAVDHDSLRRERSVRSRGLKLQNSEFVAPPGSELVIRVMNRLKRKYRFVDLLKPETGAVLPLLLALAPSMRESLEGVAVMAQLAWRRREHTLAAPAVPRHSGDLSAAGESGALDDILREEVGDDASLYAKRTGDLSSGDERYDKRVLQRALRTLNRDDRSFYTGWEAPEYLSSARAILQTGSFDAVVFGHTHLPKSIVFEDSTRYLNTGTWCDVIRLPNALLEEGVAAEAELVLFLDALKSNDLGKYRTRYLAFVEAVVNERGTVESITLHGYGGRGHERSGRLPPSPKSNG